MLRTPIKVFAFGFSRHSLTIKKTDYLWYKDLRESLYIKLPGATGVSVQLNRDESSSVLAEKIEDGLFRADISSIVYKINNEQRLRRFYLNVDYTTYRDRWLTLPVVYRKPTILPYFVLNYTEDDGVYTEVSIVGHADIFLTVKDHETQDVIIQKQRIVNGKNMFLELTPEGFYDFEPVMSESDGFFDTLEEPLQIIKGTGVVSITDLTNCRLPIENLIHLESEVSLKTLGYFVNVQKKINANTYVGALKARPITSSNKLRETKYCGRVMVTVYLDVQGMTFSMRMFSFSDEEWEAPYFDKTTGRIWGGDSPIILNSKDYNRFILLDEDEAAFSIIIDEIRRFR